MCVHIYSDTNLLVSGNLFSAVCDQKTVKSLASRPADTNLSLDSTLRPWPIDKTYLIRLLWLKVNEMWRGSSLGELSFGQSPFHLHQTSHVEHVQCRLTALSEASGTLWRSGSCQAFRLQITVSLQFIRRQWRLECFCTFYFLQAVGTLTRFFKI